MPKPETGIRAEILNKLQYSISNKENEDLASSHVLRDLSSRLYHVQNPQERKYLIENWYNDLLSAERVRKYHFVYKTPKSKQQLNSFLSHLTARFKKRFNTYITE